MSGGHFDYKQYNIGYIADEIEDLIHGNGCKDEDNYGCKIYQEFSLKTIDKFREALNTLRRAQVMAHRIDWLASSDDGEEQFHLRWDEELEKLKCR